MNIDNAIGILQTINTCEPWRIAHQIAVFQELIWSVKDFAKLDAEVMETLGELAYELDFYEPDVKMRAEDPSFFDEVKARAEVQLALEKIALLTNKPSLLNKPLEDKT